MKTINLENKEEGDDREMIQLLREHLKETPPDHLIDNTMNAFVTARQLPATRFRPLLSPLLIMAGIMLLLIMPWIAPSTINAPHNSLPQMNDMNIRVLKYLSWFWMASVLLAIGRLIISNTPKIKLKHSRP